MAHNLFLITFIILSFTCSVIQSESTGITGVHLITNPSPNPDKEAMVPIKDPTRIPENTLTANLEQFTGQQPSTTEKPADNALVAEKEVTQEAQKEKDAPVDKPAESVPTDAPVVASGNVDQGIKEEPKTVDPVTPTPTSAPTEEPKKSEENKEVKPTENPVVAPVNTPTEVPVVPKDNVETVKDEPVDPKKDVPIDKETPLPPRCITFVSFFVGVGMIVSVLVFGLACYYRHHLKEYRQAPFTPPSFCPSFLFPDIGFNRGGSNKSDTYKAIEIGQYNPPGRH